MTPDPVLSLLLARVEALVRTFGEQACSDVWEAIALTVALRPFPSRPRRERLLDLWRQRRRWRAYRRREARLWPAWLRAQRWAPGVELDDLGPLEDLRRVAA